MAHPSDEGVRTLTLSVVKHDARSSRTGRIAARASGKATADNRARFCSIRLALVLLIVEVSYEKKESKGVPKQGWGKRRGRTWLYTSIQNSTVRTSGYSLPRREP